MITFSTCYYIIPSKFHSNKYIEWMNNFISIVNNFYLVIYTDENTSKYINTRHNPKIKVIIKPFEEFYNYRYKEFWIQNHNKNKLLNKNTCWQVNMLWSEKIAFVKETFERKYFETEFYGWCDIGYFRNRQNDIHTNHLQNWAHTSVIKNINTTKIIYGCVQNDNNYLNNLINGINNKNNNGLPIIPIPENQISISGGFFILHQSLIPEWFSLYDNKLAKYFLHDYLVKDDQIILADCIFSNLDKFILLHENTLNMDNWFMFQRILNYVNIRKQNIDKQSVKKISILMPIYNGIEFIEESVTSIINQTFSNWELIIGINGHPENSLVFQKAKVFEKIDERIKVFDFFQLKGKSVTLNKMLLLCKYDYIALLDVDDIWHPNKLEVQLPFIGKYDVVGTKCVYFGDMEGISPEIPLRDISKYDFLKENPIINSSSLIKKEVCFWNEKFDVEDYELWLRLWKQNKTFYNCPEILVKHRIHIQSAFNSKGNHHKAQILLQIYGNINSH